MESLREISCEAIPNCRSTKKLLDISDHDAKPQYECLFGGETDVRQHDEVWGIEERIVLTQRRFRAIDIGGCTRNLALFQGIG